MHEDAKNPSKSRKSEDNPPSKMVTMDKKSMKNQFKIIQKLLGNIFDNKDILFYHSDHLKAKAEGWRAQKKVRARTQRAEEVARAHAERTQKNPARRNIFSARAHAARKKILRARAKIWNLLNIICKIFCLFTLQIWVFIMLNSIKVRYRQNNGCLALINEFSREKHIISWWILVCARVKKLRARKFSWSARA